MNLSDFKITEVREFEHRRGVAWEAEISLNGEVVIGLANEGIGGLATNWPCGSKSGDHSWLRQVEKLCTSEVTAVTLEGGYLNGATLEDAVCFGDVGDNLREALEKYTTTILAEYRGNDYGDDDQ